MHSHLNNQQIYSSDVHHTFIFHEHFPQLILVLLLGDGQIIVQHWNRTNKYIIDEFHKWTVLVTCRKLAIDHNTLPELLNVFEHKT